MRRPTQHAALLVTLLTTVTTLGAGCSPDPEDPTPGAEQTRAPARRWTARLELPTRGQPEMVGILDLTGDGHAELWALTRAAPAPGGRSVGTLHLWQDALLAPRVIELPDYPVGAVPLRRAGRWWLAIASRSTDELILLDPTAVIERDAGERGMHRVPLPGRPRAVAAGPLWSDERWAVACATAAGELLLFDADGALVDARKIGALLPTLVAVGPGEVSVGCQADRSLRRWTLRPDGSLGPSPEVVMLDGIPRDLLEVDLDGDGSRERVLAGGDDSLWVLGPGGPVARRVGPIPLALASDSASSLFLLTHANLAYTQLEAGRRVHQAYAGQDVWDIAVGDLDRDGYRDLAIANRGASRVSLVFGGPEGFLEAERVPTGAGPQRMAIGDLDGDGRAEIVTVNATDGDLSVLSDDGGGYRTLRRLPAGPGVDRVCIADV
ncbi:MAG: VCBS repeat-containing protein, partial [Planctomycetota bacterium]